MPTDVGMTRRLGRRVDFSPNWYELAAPLGIASGNLGMVLSLPERDKGP